MRKEAKIKSRCGLHARPAKAISEVGRKYPGTDIYIKKKNSNRMGKSGSILSLLMLKALQGDNLIIEAAGPDEERAITEVTKIVEEFQI